MVRHSIIVQVISIYSFLAYWLHSIFLIIIHVPYSKYFFLGLKTITCWRACVCFFFLLCLFICPFNRLAIHVAFTALHRTICRAKLSCPHHGFQLPLAILPLDLAGWCLQITFSAIFSNFTFRCLELHQFERNSKCSWNEAMECVKNQNIWNESLHIVG